MPRHVLHILAVAVATVIAALPIQLLTPAASDFVANHPGVAGYLVVAVALLTKVVKFLGNVASGSSPGAAAPGGGSDTMGAK